MLSDAARAFIEENEFCSVLLFPNWQDFLRIVYENGDAVDAVAWWEHVPIVDEDALTDQAHKDREKPGWVYVDTPLYAAGFADKSFDELEAYLSSVIEEHPDTEYVPSFYLFSD